MTDAQRGYNSHGCHDPQVNLMYALAVDGEKACPVFYKSHPGSVRDASAFGNMMREMGIETAVILADKGFHGSGDGEELDGALQQHSPLFFPEGRTMACTYLSGIGRLLERAPGSREEIQAKYAQCLEEAFPRDCREGMTHYGPQRSDLACLLQGKVLASYPGFPSTHNEECHCGGMTSNAA